MLRQVLVPERGGSTGEEGCAGCLLKVLLQIRKQAPAPSPRDPRPVDSTHSSWQGGKWVSGWAMSLQGARATSMGVAGKVPGPIEVRQGGEGGGSRSTGDRGLYLGPDGPYSPFP